MVILLFVDATEEVAQELVSTYHMKHPVLLDHDWQVANRYQPMNFPSYTLIAPGMKLSAIDAGWIEPLDIERILPE